MPRYVVERTYEAGLHLRSDAAGAEACNAVVRRDSEQGVTWLHSYVSNDGSRSFCLYEGPSPEAIRKAAAANRLPVDRITEIGVLDPYFRACRRPSSAAGRPGCTASAPPTRRRAPSPRRSRRNRR